MEVSLINHMGNDLSVVNAARVSFDKESEYGWRPGTPEEVGISEGTLEVWDLKEKDKKLIKYLAKHKHWSPFSHNCISFKIDAPIFVARQLAKHQVGLSWNEVSRRYVDDPNIKFYNPSVWRARAENKKQGSLDSAVATTEDIAFDYNHFCMKAIELYQRTLDDGVCPEQARMVLPQSMYSSWHWTGSLYAFARVYNLRSKEDAQYETRIIAQKIGSELKDLFPYSWSALTQE